MLVFSLNRFAVQKRTSTYRRQKLCSIYLSFILQWSGLTPSFQIPQEVALKLQEPINARKRKYMCLVV